MSRLNPQGQWGADVNCGAALQATKKKTCGGSNFKVQEFKVNFYLAALKPKLSLSRKRSLFQWFQPFQTFHHFAPFKGKLEVGNWHQTQQYNHDNLSSPSS
jgi:hypothetical protein